MSNETLRVRVVLMGDTVVMRVFAMPERFRRNFTFEASNGMEVESDRCPAIAMRDGDDYVMLHGHERERDNDITGADFFDGDAARRAYNRVVAALHEAKAEMERILHEESAGESLDNTLTFDDSATI